MKENLVLPFGKPANLQTRKLANLQTYSVPGLQVCRKLANLFGPRFAGLPQTCKPANLKTYLDPGLQVCRFATWQICKFATLQIWSGADEMGGKFTNLQTCKLAKLLQVCRFAEWQTCKP